jgi:rare lipoprotein A
MSTIARMAVMAGVTLAALGAAGCRHRKTATDLPPLPPITESANQRPSQRGSAQRDAQTTARSGYKPAPIPITPVPAGGVSKADLNYVETHDPIYTEQGLATWYTAPYQGRKAANGQVFSDRALTAAHRTLPMGSLIVVTNLKTGDSSAMRVTDRGPFVDGRIVDLTIASAKATGIYRTGMERVRVDVYKTPKPMDVGGRWCVQIGAFRSEQKALRLKSQLLRTYPEAQVIEFPGEASYWVRIRPQGDNRQEAEYIAHHLKPAEGEAFLTRLD